MSNNNNNREQPGWLFLKVLVSPGQALAKIAEKPSFLKTALVITGLSLIIGAALSPKIQAFTVWTLTHGPAVLPPEQREQVLSYVTKFSAAGTIASTLIAPWFVWLVVAGLLKLYFVLSGKAISFKTLFAVAVYGYLPVFAGWLIVTPITLAVPVENLQNVTLSLAAFLPAQKSLLYFFLTKCSPFTWWSLILWGIGGASAAKTQPGGVIAYNFGWWLVYALLAASFALLKAPAGMGG